MTSFHSLVFSGHGGGVTNNGSLQRAQFFLNTLKEATGNGNGVQSGSVIRGKLKQV